MTWQVRTAACFYFALFFQFMMYSPVLYFVSFFIFYSCTSAHACFGEQTVAAKWFHCAADATMRDETPLHAVVVSAR